MRSLLSHRRPALPLAGRPARGMTLIEVMIALLIMGMMMFIAIPSLESVFGVKAREEAGRIAGSIRYLYGTSALYGKVCRLVFDLDGSSYWAECTNDRFTIAKEDSFKGKKEEDEDETRASRPTGAMSDEAVRALVEKKASFSAFGSEEVPKTKLPNGATLAVWTEHQTDQYTQGIAYLYFFPQGHTEKARIWISSGHGDTYTLSVSPLNGRVLVSGESLEVPRS